MSTPRICDVKIAPDCPSRSPYHGVFSEADYGWTTFNGAKRILNDKTGKTEVQEVEQDACPPCTSYREGTHPTQQRHSKRETPELESVPGGKHLVDSEEYAGYMEYLEKQGEAANV